MLVLITDRPKISGWCASTRVRGLLGVKTFRVGVHNGDFFSEGFLSGCRYIDQPERRRHAETTFGTIRRGSCQNNFHASASFKLILSTKLCAHYTGDCLGMEIKRDLSEA